MKRRVRWHHVDLGRVSMSTLQARLIDDKYSEDVSSGFYVETANRRFTKGVFVEKVDVIDEVRDPFGNVHRFPRIEFREVAFYFSPGRPNLELWDPPRSCKSFFARIGSILEHQATFEPIQPDVDRWLKALEGRVGRVQVQSMSISDISLSTTVRADMVVVGSQGVRREVAKLLEQRIWRLAAVDVAWSHADELITCELSKNGATYDESTHDAASVALRPALEETLAPTQKIVLSKR